MKHYWNNGVDTTFLSESENSLRNCTYHAYSSAKIEKSFSTKAKTSYLHSTTGLKPSGYGHGFKQDQD